VIFSDLETVKTIHQKAFWTRESSLFCFKEPEKFMNQCCKNRIL